MAQVFGDKDADGFYWGELRGRRGYVPHNMVSEMEDTTTQITGGQTTTPGTGQVIPGQNAPQQSMRNVSRDRWGDIYANMPVKRMVALYDYDPQELSPNVDAEVSARQRQGHLPIQYSHHSRLASGAVFQDG